MGREKKPTTDDIFCYDIPGLPLWKKAINIDKWKQLVSAKLFTGPVVSLICQFSFCPNLVHFCRAKKALITFWVMEKGKKHRKEISWTQKMKNYSTLQAVKDCMCFNRVSKCTLLNFCYHIAWSYKMSIKLRNAKLKIAFVDQTLHYILGGT